MTREEIERKIAERLWATHSAADYTALDDLSLRVQKLWLAVAREAMAMVEAAKREAFLEVAKMARERASARQPAKYAGTRKWADDYVRALWSLAEELESQAKYGAAEKDGPSPTPRPRATEAMLATSEEQTSARAFEPAIGRDAGEQGKAVAHEPEPRSETEAAYVSCWCPYRIEYHDDEGRKESCDCCLEAARAVRDAMVDWVADKIGPGLAILLHQQFFDAKDTALRAAIIRGRS